MAFTEDLTPFFNEDDFGVSVLWHPETGGEYTVTGIFDGPHTIQNPETLEAESSTPQLWLPAYEVDGIKNDDSFEINGVDYKVLSVEPDGTGVLVIQLTKDDE